MSKAMRKKIEEIGNRLTYAQGARHDCTEWSEKSSYQDGMSLDAWIDEAFKDALTLAATE